MQNEVKLVIRLKVNELITKEMKKIDLVFASMSLNNMDKFTYPYQNEQDFFEKHKNEIMEKLIDEYTFYGLEKPPANVELNLEVKNSIYILREERRISPLFQNILFYGNKENLDALIKKRLEKGELKFLWTFDIGRQELDADYESIFKDCDRKLLAKIEADLLNKNDIQSILNFLKDKNRFFAIVRFLLLEGNLVHYFLENIPLQEYMEEEYTLEREIKQYWWNKDD